MHIYYTHIHIYILYTHTYTPYIHAYIHTSIYTYAHNNKITHINNSYHLITYYDLNCIHLFIEYIHTYKHMHTYLLYAHHTHTLTI